MNQCGCFIFDTAVIATVRTTKRRPNCMLTQNSTLTAYDKCIGMASYRVIPCDSVVSPSYLLESPMRVAIPLKSGELSGRKYG